MKTEHGLLALVVIAFVAAIGYEYWKARSRQGQNVPTPQAAATVVYGSPTPRTDLSTLTMIQSGSVLTEPPTYRVDAPIPTV